MEVLYLLGLHAHRERLKMNKKQNNELIAEYGRRLYGQRGETAREGDGEAGCCVG